MKTDNSKTQDKGQNKGQEPAETKWTPEPWKRVNMHYEGAGGATVQLEPVGSIYDQGRDEARMLACVNKLAGHADLDAVEIVPKGTIEALRVIINLVTLARADGTGAWTVDAEHAFYAARSILSGDVFRPAYVGEALAKDAALIASAPELLEALRRVEKLIVLARQYFPKSMHNSDKFQLEQTCAAVASALHLAYHGRNGEAAIARAEGKVKP